MDERKELLEFVHKLEGISYWDWQKVKTAIDRNFEMKISESKRGMQLTNPKEVEAIIRSQFG